MPAMLVICELHSIINVMIIVIAVFLDHKNNIKLILFSPGLDQNLVTAASYMVPTKYTKYAKQVNTKTPNYNGDGGHFMVPFYNPDKQKQSRYTNILVQNIFSIANNIN